MISTNPLILLIILITILVVALGINYYYHQREQRARQREQRSRQLKKEIQQGIDALSTLKGFSTPPEIIALLSEYCARRIGQLAELNPAAGVVDQLRSRSSAQAPAPMVAQGLHSVHLLQQAIRTTIGIIRHYQQQGRVTPLQAAEFGQELSWLSIASEADLYIQEGQKLKENGKLGLALTHLRHAKTLIAKVPSKEARRQPKLTEIQALLDEASPFKPTPPANDAESNRSA